VRRPARLVHDAAKTRESRHLNPRHLNQGMETQAWESKLANSVSFFGKVAVAFEPFE